MDYVLTITVSIAAAGDALFGLLGPSWIHLKLPAAGFSSVGTDAAQELDRLRHQVAERYPRAIFFAGQLVFQKDTWYGRLLHNETAYHLQRRLKLAGLPLVILPTRVR